MQTLKQNSLTQATVMSTTVQARQWVTVKLKIPVERRTMHER